MKPGYMSIGLLLIALAAGCASQQDVQTLRADVQALERRRSPDLDKRVQAVGEQLGRLEQSQTEARRELAQTVAAMQELRVELQRLRGEVQETRQQMKRGFTATPERDSLSTKLAELQTRLEAVESRRGAEGNATALPRPPTTVLSEPLRPPTSTPEALQPLSQAAVKAQPPPATKPPAATPQGSDEADSLYKRALQEQRNGNHEVALVLFKQYLRQHPKAAAAGQAQYGVGESLYAQKQYEAAIVAFDEVIRKYPNDNRIPAALLKQGYAFAELKDVRNARFFLQQVQQKYPNSPEAKQAEERLKQLQRQG